MEIANPEFAKGIKLKGYIDIQICRRGLGAGSGQTPNQVRKSHIDSTLQLHKIKQLAPQLLKMLSSPRPLGGSK